MSASPLYTKWKKLCQLVTTATSVSRRCYFRDIVVERSRPRVPVITTPLKLLEKTKRLRQRKMASLSRYDECYGVDRRRDRLIVACTRKSDNHYAHQRYPPNRSITLGSQCWQSTKCAGEIVTINQRRSAEQLFFDDDDGDSDNLHISSFDDFPNLCDALKSILNRSFDGRPTNVQRLAMPKLLAGVNGIVAAETGSGKTLAYLAPVVQKLLEGRERHGPPEPNRPRAVVLAPNSELVSQVFTVLRTLIADTDLVAAQITANDYYPSVLAQPVDIVVATPGRLRKFKRLDAVDFSALRHAVVDEADTLLDATFRDVMLDLFAGVPFDRRNETGFVQLILCSATFFEYVDEFLGGLDGLESSGFEHLITSNLHVLQPHIVHRFVRVIKPALPERLLYLARRDARPSIVFVKNVDQGMFVRKFLSRENGVACSFLYRDLRRFHDCEKVLRDFRNGVTRLLISTNLGSRGLDAPNARHVINYDFPKTMADYLHRAGRLGRAGGVGGVVTSFVYDRASAEMIKTIETSVRTNAPLKNVHSNIRAEFYEQRKANKDNGPEGALREEKFVAK